MTGATRNPWGVRVIGWVLVYLALAGALGMELDWGRRIRLPIPAPKPAPAARADYSVQPEFALLPLEQGFVETTARPVFTPVRRPPPPPAPPEPPKPTMKKGQFVLLGALITKEKNVALLREVATGKATRVEQGKEIKDITVANVLPEKVILTQYDDTEELELKIQPMSNHAVTPRAMPKQPEQPEQQSGQVAPSAPADSPATPASGVPGAAAGSIDPQSRINRRRAARGLPPI